MSIQRNEPRDKQNYIPLDKLLTDLQRHAAEIILAVCSLKDSGIMDKPGNKALSAAYHAMSDTRLKWLEHWPYYRLPPMDLERLAKEAGVEIVKRSEDLERINLRYGSSNELLNAVCIIRALLCDMLCHSSELIDHVYSWERFADDNPWSDGVQVICLSLDADMAEIDRRLAELKKTKKKWEKAR